MGYVSSMGEKKNVYRVLVGKSERKSQCGTPRHGWNSDIKIDLEEIGWEGVNWIYLAQDRNK